MADKPKIVIPERMLAAALRRVHGGYAGSVTMLVEVALYEALRWLSENPISPTKEQRDELCANAHGLNDKDKVHWVVAEWQRRMFLEPDPDAPISDLFISVKGCEEIDERFRETFDARIREAFRRGVSKR